MRSELTARTRSEESPQDTSVPSFRHTARCARQRLRVYCLTVAMIHSLQRDDPDPPVVHRAGAAGHPVFLSEGVAAAGQPGVQVERARLDALVRGADREEESAFVDRSAR